MYVNNPNLIVYNGNYVVLHGGTTYDKNGNATGSIDSNLFDKFSKALAAVESQKTDWSISKPAITAINNISNKTEYLEIISRLDNEIAKYNANGSTNWKIKIIST